MRLTCVHLREVLHGGGGGGVGQRGADRASPDLSGSPQRKPDHGRVVVDQAVRSAEGIPLKVLLCAKM